MCQTHDLYMKSIPLSQYYYQQVSSFLKKHWCVYLFLLIHLNLLFVFSFSTIRYYISENLKVKVKNVWNIFVFFHYVLLLLYKIIKHIMHSSQSSTREAKIIQSSKHGRKKQYVVRRSKVKVWKIEDKLYVIFRKYMTKIVYDTSWLVICPILYQNADCQT